MSACVIWIDSEHAKLFKITTEGVAKKTLKHHSVDPKNVHHDNHKHNAEEQFFHEVTSAIGDVEELLVFGSGMARIHFKAHLDKHHHRQLLSHLVGVEPLDHLTDNQILEAARKFFKKFNAYNSSI